MSCSGFYSMLCRYAKFKELEKKFERKLKRVLKKYGWL